MSKHTHRHTRRTTPHSSGSIVHPKQEHESFTAFIIYPTQRRHKYQYLCLRVSEYQSQKRRSKLSLFLDCFEQNRFTIYIKV